MEKTQQLLRGYFKIVLPETRNNSKTNSLQYKWKTKDILFLFQEALKRKKFFLEVSTEIVFCTVNV